MKIFIILFLGLEGVNFYLCYSIDRLVFFWGHLIGLAIGVLIVLIILLCGILKSYLQKNS